MNNSPINWVSSAKNLGVYFDSRLTFNVHVNHITRISFFKLKSLYHLKHQLNENIKLKLVKSLIFPHIDYCCMVYYFFLTGYNREKLQKLQNACLRFACNIHYRDHVTPHYNKLGLLKIDYRVTYLFLSFLYKLLLSKIPSYLHDVLIRRSAVHNVNIRRDHFTIPQHSTGKFEGSFSYNAPRLLNQHINKISKTFFTFKRELRENLLLEQS